MPPPSKSEPASEDPAAGEKTQNRPPPKRRPAGEDPEVNNKTGVRSAPADPETNNKTGVRAPPVDPETSNKTGVRAPPVDPETNNKTGVRKPPVDPETHSVTQAKAPMPKRKGKAAAPLDEPSYSTGQSYVPDEGEEPAGSVDLEGDGLEALDPELAPKTTALKAYNPAEASAGAGGDDDDDEDDDANATRAGPPLKLEIIAGPDAGKKKKIKAVRMVIGRTPGVDLQLSDQSVSRRHIELVRGDGGVLLRDLGSGNGTKVNGQKVSEKQLEHGDEIAIGKTKLRFVDEVGAFVKARDENAKKGDEKKEEEKKDEPAEGEEKQADEAKEGEEKAEGEEKKADEAKEGEEKPEGDEAKAEGEEAKAEGDDKPKDRSKPVRTSRNAPDKKPGSPAVKIGIAAAVVLLLVVIIAVAAGKKGGSGSGSGGQPVAGSPEANKAAAAEKMQQARNAVAAGKYEEAVKLIELAEEMQPGVDQTKLGNAAREALAIVRGFDEAKAAIAQNRFEDARKILGKLTVSSKFEDDKRRIDVEIDEKELAYKIDKIDELLASGDLDGAKTLLGQLPVEKQQGPAAKISEFERMLEEVKAEEEAKERANATNNAINARNRREEEITLAFAFVERKFAGGEWDRAASECVRVIEEHPGDREILKRAKELQGQIPAFGRAYEEGMKKFKLGQLTQASKPLRTAWGLYAKIGLRGNEYRETLAEKLAEASLVAGKEALIRGDIASAAVAFKDAAKLDPSDPRGKQGLDEVVSKADDLYQEAYMIRDREPREAMQKFKIVVDVTPPGSATHEKAKNQIAAMAP